MGPVLILLLLVGMLVPTAVRADTVYLKDGQSIWGRSVFEEGDHVVIVRPSGNVRIPKAHVGRIEPVRNTLPPHYSPPGSTAAETPAAGAPGAPAAVPAAAPRAGGPVATPAPAASPSPGGVSPAALAPTPARPTALPPPPPPPPPRQ